MNSNKYTLDRFEGDHAIFLKRSEETEQLLIHQSNIHVPVKEGDIVQIVNNGEEYEIQVLNKETSNKKDMIQNLINELKR